MRYLKPFLAVAVLLASLPLARSSSAYDYQNVITSHERTFAGWEVALIVNRSNRAEYIRMSTTLPGTKTEFEILFRRRYFDEPEKIIYLFNRLSEPDVYLSPAEMKWVGSFALDERLYAVQLTHSRIGESNLYTSIVADPPDNFVYMIADSQRLMFRMVNGFVYDIPLLGFREALAYVEELKKELRWRYGLPGGEFIPDEAPRYDYQWREWPNYDTSR